jgi:ubiquinol-cytochrome c reductase cytochrome b subunit
MHKPNFRGPQFRSVHQFIVVALIRDCCLLTWLGSQPVEAPYVVLGQTATIMFFV